MTMVLISSINGNGSSTAITFSSIPQTGTDLLLLFSGRSPNATVSDALVTVNGSASGYGGIYLRAVSTSISSSSFSADKIDVLAGAPGTSLISGSFSTFRFYISNYTLTGNKAMSVDTSTMNNISTPNYDMIGVGTWNSTAAITSLTITSGAAQPWSTDTYASLYSITK